jgi:hypothetical protein
MTPTPEPTPAPDPALPPDPAATTGRRSPALIVAGVVVSVGLLAVAGVLWTSADRRYDDNVAAFARAPSGCDTTLEFERTGRFTLYIETAGELPALSGDCDVDERYDREATDPPEVQLVLRDGRGDALALDDADGPDYDTGTFVGSARHEVEISEVGDHVLTVDDDGGAPFAVAIGASPDDGVGPLRWGAVAALIAALIGGGALLVAGGRRPERAVATVPADSAVAPTGPPGFPPPPPTTGATGPALPGGPPSGPPIVGPAPGAPPSATTDDVDEAPPAPWGPPST